jgi:hypothetical protein
MMFKTIVEGMKKEFPPLDYTDVPEVDDTYGISETSDPARKKCMAHPTGRVAQCALRYMGWHYSDADLLRLLL